MAAVLPVPAHGHGEDKKKKKKPLKPSEDRKRKKPSEVKSPERAKKKKKEEVPHEQQQQRATPSAKKQKPLPFQRTWTPNDEVRILEAMAAHRQEHGKVPTAAELLPVLDGRLDRKRPTYKKLAEKLRTFMRRHSRDAKNGAPTQAHERRLYDLSRNVWVDHTQAPNPSVNAGLANEHDGVPSEGKTFDEMRDSYPNLTQAVMLLVDAKAKPADLETALMAIDDSKAHALDLKVSKLRNELTEAIMESATIQSTEKPKIWRCASTKLQPEFEAEIEKNFQTEHLDETEVTRVKLARMEQEIFELKQSFLAFQSSPMADSKKQRDKSSAKGIICKSSESVLRSVVADNLILCNTLQSKKVVQQKFPCGETKEVTSKHRHPQNLEIQKMIYGQGKMPYGRKKNEAGSHTKRNVELRRVTTHGHQEDRNKEVIGGKVVLLLSTTWPHVPVAKATLQTSSGSTIVGGMPLGSECYQVFVNDVLKEEAPLLRPPGMKMAEALKSFIAWPRAQIRWCNYDDPVKPGLPSRPGH